MALNIIATAKQVIDTEIPASALTIDDMARQVVTPPTFPRSSTALMSMPSRRRSGSRTARALT